MSLVLIFLKIPKFDNSIKDKLDNNSGLKEKKLLKTIPGIGGVFAAEISSMMKRI